MVNSPTEPKWQRFERLVAALHHALSPSGAVVTWDDRIDGRQFDVTIRFSEVAYNFLTIVECKDYVVPVGDVEAFVTKTRAAHANKAVVISSKGFQSGALKVAAEHGIDLHVLGESDEWPPGLRIVSEEPALSVTDVELVAGDEALHRFRDDPSALVYFMTHVNVYAGGRTRTLDDTIMSERPAWEKGTDGTPQIRVVALPRDAVVQVPFIDPMRPTAVRFTTQHVSAKTLDTGGMDVSMVPQLFRLTNAITGEQRTIDAAELWIGFDTTIRASRFYRNPFLSIVYYCETVVDDLATYVLLESYQHATLVQARFKQKVLYGRHLLEITDSKELTRLKRMLAQFQAGPTRPTARLGRNEPCPCGSGEKYKRCHRR